MPSRRWRVLGREDRLLRWNGLRRTIPGVDRWLHGVAVPTALAGMRSGFHLGLVLEKRIRPCW